MKECIFGDLDRCDDSDRPMRIFGTIEFGTDLDDDYDFISIFEI